MPAELIVTNNSPEDSIPLESDGHLRVSIEASDNVGYGAGINKALRRAQGEYLLVANPDIRVQEGALAGGVEYLRVHEDVGIVLPTLHYPDGAIQPSVRMFYSWPVVMYARSPFRAFMPPPAFFRHYLCANIDRSHPSDVDWGLGAAMFLRRADWPDGDLFDDRFFLYFEDVDLCYRSWQRGLRVVYCPHLVFEHFHRRHSANPVGKAGWHHFQSMMRFIQKYRGLPRRPTRRES
jgi:GT2 family glycosyltransferase